MSQEFSIQARVYYEDTDAGGIVYHANYLKFCERARSDFIRSLGIDQQDLLQKRQGFVIARMEARFKRPARLNELLTISCVPQKLRRVAIDFLQQVKNEAGQVVFEMTCEIAYINIDKGTLLPLPEQTLQTLAPYVNGE